MDTEKQQEPEGIEPIELEELMTGYLRIDEDGDKFIIPKDLIEDYDLMLNNLRLAKEGSSDWHMLRNALYEINRQYMILGQELEDLEIIMPDD